MLQSALHVVHALEEAGFTAIVAGGAARDIHHGVAPKDWDIILISECEVQEVYDALFLLDEDAEPFGDGASMTATDDPRNLDFVIKLRYMGADMDVIRQASFPETPEAAVEAFDCSLNMAWVGPSGDVVLHKDYPEPGGLVKMLPLCDYPASRARYLSAKFPEYQWPTFETLEQICSRMGTQCAAV